MGWLVVAVYVLLALLLFATGKVLCIVLSALALVAAGFMVFALRECPKDSDEHGAEKLGSFAGRRHGS